MNELKHIAIIMDGNGRWAKKQGLIRSFGHKAGANNVENILKSCLEFNVKNLSLFAFSTENWQRPKNEVDFIFSLFDDYLSKYKEKFKNEGVCFKVFGDITKLNKKLQNNILEFSEYTKNENKINFNLAINYGAKDELVRTFKKIQEKNLQINEENITKNLDISTDVDLLIRTGDCTRISNFMLWQCAYAQIHFTKTLFPDFSSLELEQIINDFLNTKRTFGGV